MRLLSLSLASAFALAVVAIPVADAWNFPALKASVTTKYELRAAIKAKKTSKKRPASIELPAAAKGGLLFGDAEAGTTIIMFTDIECPFCKQFHAKTYPSLKKDYLDTGKARFVIRHFPLSFHTYASMAARSVICAREQGDDKARALYTSLIGVKKLSPLVILEQAVSAGLDKDILSSCVDGKGANTTLEADIKLGTDANVSGTPSFLIVGPAGASQTVAGAMPLETFTKAIAEVQKK